MLNFRVSNALTGTATIQIATTAQASYNTVSIQTGNELAEMPGGFEIFAGTGNLRASIELLPLESISLSDIDLTVPGNTPIMYFVNLHNDNTPRYVNITVRLSSASKGNIGNMLKNNVSVTANQYLRITNRDFTKVNLNGIAGSDFLKAVKVLGTFPPDDYTYKLEVTDEKGIIIATDETTTTTTNPRYNPELISPGASFERNLDDVYTAFPLFQWFGQMDKYDLTLYEVMPGQTAEEAVRNIFVFRQQDIYGTSLVYPAYAEKLISGKVYAWQVAGKVATGKGELKLPSEVYRFRYITPGEAPPEQLVTRLAITPSELNVKMGEQHQFTAIAYDANDNVVQNIQTQWHLSSNKGSVNQNGLFKAGGAQGTVAVVVKAGAVTEYAVVNISADMENINSWLMKDVMRQLFGLPPQ